MDCIKTKVFWTVVDTSRVGAFQKWGLRVIEKGFMIDSSCFLIMKRSWHWKLNLGCSKFMLGFVRKYLYHWKSTDRKKNQKILFFLVQLPEAASCDHLFFLLLAAGSAVYLAFFCADFILSGVVFPDALPSSASAPPSVLSHPLWCWPAGYSGFRAISRVMLSVASFFLVLALL